MSTSRPRSPGLALLVGLLLVATVVVGAFQRCAVTSPWWLELSRYLPYPVYLATPILALVMSASLGWAWRAASVAAVLGTALFTMDFHWQLGEPELPANGHPLRFMTYNIKAYKAAERNGGFEALGEEIALRDPDVLVMQDTQTPSKLPPHFVAGAPVFGLPNVYLSQKYIVASKLPLRDCNYHGIPEAGYGYVLCTLTVDGRDASIVSAHFDSPRQGLVAARREGLEGADDWQRNYADRLIQSRGMAAQLQSAPRPLIVGGDLNALEASPVVRSLLGLGLRDAFSAGGTGWGYTYGDTTSVRMPFLRIDHILVSERIGVVDAFVGNAGPSEHRPLIADLVLPP